MKFYDSAYLIGYEKEKPIREMRVHRNAKAAWILRLSLPENSTLVLNEERDYMKPGSYHLLWESEPLLEVYVLHPVQAKDGNSYHDLLLKRDILRTASNDVYLFVEADIPKSFPRKDTVSFFLFRTDPSGKTGLVDTGHLLLRRRAAFYHTNRFRFDPVFYPSTIAFIHDLELFSDEYFNELRSYMKVLKDYPGARPSVNLSDAPVPDTIRRQNFFGLNRKNPSQIYNFEYLRRYLEIIRFLDLSDRIPIYGLRLTKKECPGPPYPVYIETGNPLRPFLEEKKNLKHYLSAFFNCLSEETSEDAPVVIRNEKEESVEDFFNKAAGRRLNYRYLRGPYGDCMTPAEFSVLLQEGPYPGNPRENYRDLYIAEEDPSEPFSLALGRPLKEARFYGALIFLLDAGGLRRESDLFYVSNKYIRPSLQGLRYRDMHLLYPGSDGPRKSLRERNLYYGMIDYSLLRDKEDEFPEVREYLKIQTGFSEDYDEWPTLFSSYSRYEKILNRALRSQYRRLTKL